MIRSFHVARYKDPTVDLATARVRAMLEASHLATIEATLLRQAEPDAQRVGSKPLLTLVDDASRRYVLKAGEPALNVAEQAAFELRQLGDRPAVPARVATVNVAELGRVEGLIKPYLDFDPTAELGSDTTTWTPLQRGVMLLEHAWEWFLDNLDTNPGQYVLLGDDAYPVNLDWDRAFASEGRSELSRFAKYRSTLPNARTFLYADYVEGRIDLPFALLTREARLIRRLPISKVQRAFTSFAEAQYSNPTAARAFVSRMIRRQRSIESQISRFIRSLRNERRAFADPSAMDTRALMRKRATMLWAQWQVVLNTVVRGPVGTCGRLMLKFTRRGSLRLDASAQIDRHETT